MEYTIFTGQGASGADSQSSMSQGVPGRVQCSRCKSYSDSGMVSHVVVDGASQVVCFLCVTRESVEGRVLPGSASGQPRTRKILCSTCGFMVNPVGHDQRCQLREQRTLEETARMRSMAWLGDVTHTADVRVFLLCSGVAFKDLQTTAQSYIEASAQAEFYVAAESPKERALGTSVRQLSTAFEASYKGAFRYEYVSKNLPSLLTASLSTDLSGFVQPGDRYHIF